MKKHSTKSPKVILLLSDLILESLLIQISCDTHLFEILGVWHDYKHLPVEWQEPYPDFLLTDSLVFDNNIRFWVDTPNFYQDKIIVYSYQESFSLINHILTSSTISYIQHGCDYEELVTCLKRIFSGKRIIYYTGSLGSNLMEERKPLLFFDKYYNVYDLSKLTSREQAVWKLVSQERTEKEIAQILMISLYTVKKHKSNIATKIGIKNKNKLTQIVVT